MLQQADAPQRLYDDPVNLFVAGIIGSPSMNLVEAALDRDDGTLVASFGSTRLAIDESVLESRPALARFEGRRVILGIRPEDFEDAEFRSDAPDDRRMEIEVDLREALGSEILLHFRVDAPIVLTDDTRELAVDVGTDSLERLEQRAQAGSSSFVARVSPRSSARRHDRVQLAVDTSRAHFFEPETGRGIRLDDSGHQGGD